MDKKRVVGAAAAVALAFGAIGPVGAAQAHPGGHGRPAVVKEARATHPEAFQAYKDSRQEARAEFRATRRAARLAFRSATVDERAEKRAALAAAKTKQERRAARQAFRDATVSERAERRAAVKAARAECRQALETAREALRS